MGAHLKNSWLYARRILLAFSEDSGGLMAAAIAFYGLLSLVPVLSFGLWVIGLFLGSSAEALPRMQASLREIFPGSGGLIYETLLAVRRDTGIAGFIGFTGLALAGSAIFANMELAFNNMWRVEKMRPWWRQRLAALGTMAITVSLIMASLVITSAITWLQNQPIPGIDARAAEFPLIWRLIGNSVPLVLTILAFSVIYKMVPNCEISWRCALRGGLFAGIFWEAAKYAFAYYAANYANFGKVYGSLGVVVSLMFWSYYTACILFLGGEIAAGRGTHEPQADPPPPNPVPRPVREGDPERPAFQRDDRFEPAN